MGFHPNDSVVLVALHGEQGRFGGRLRLGIPADSAGVARRRRPARRLPGQRTASSAGPGPTAIVVFLCQDPAEGERTADVMERLRPLAQRLRTACGALDVPVLEALCLSRRPLLVLLLPRSALLPGRRHAARTARHVRDGRGRRLRGHPGARLAAGDGGPAQPLPAPRPPRPGAGAGRGGRRAGAAHPRRGRPRERRASETLALAGAAPGPFRAGRRLRDAPRADAARRRAAQPRRGRRAHPRPPGPRDARPGGRVDGGAATPTRRCGCGGPSPAAASAPTRSTRRRR